MKSVTETGWQRWLVLPASTALLLGIAFLSLLVDRAEAYTVVAGYALAFLGFLGVVRARSVKRNLLSWLFGFGVALRLVAVFGVPLLSDDVYRFLWDGYLINAGENPFAHLPGYYLEPGNALPGLTQELYDELNSPNYHTIYPPIAQAVFTFATWLSPGNWFVAALVMKGCLLVCELGSLVLLVRLLPADRRVLYYWLNPLIVVEICGNLHFEGAMVFFLLLAYYLLKRSHWVAAGAAMAASVASKLLPLLLLPYLVRRLWGPPFWVFSVALGASLVALFLPLVTVGFLEGFGSSLDLYFRKFEFNASLYYLARTYGYYTDGWNKIAQFGPTLATLATAGILAFALLDRRSDWRSLPESWLFAFVIYLLCATTVHPWYLSVPIVLCCFTRWRFPLVWSFLITLTYVSYGSVPYVENLYLVAVEYVLTAAFAIWEWRFRISQNSRTHTPLPG